jgi:glucose-6-phosphate 1-dehydrogenase
MAAAGSDALLLFGVTGDLAHKMIFPAMYTIAKRAPSKSRSSASPSRSGVWRVCTTRNGQHPAIERDR